jgi:hypothetical protein
VSGYVYFVRPGAELVVKIGSTVEAPAARLAALQTGHHLTLSLLGAIDVRKAGQWASLRTDFSAIARRREAEIHRQFAAERLRGEWFRLSPQLEAFIAREVNA